MEVVFTAELQCDAGKHLCRQHWLLSSTWLFLKQGERFWAISFDEQVQKWIRKWVLDISFYFDYYCCFSWRFCDDFDLWGEMNSLMRQWPHFFFSKKSWHCECHQRICIVSFTQKVLNIYFFNSYLFLYNYMHQYLLFKRRKKEKVSVQILEVLFHLLKLHEMCKSW